MLSAAGCRRRTNVPVPPEETLQESPPELETENPSQQETLPSPPKKNDAAPPDEPEPSDEPTPPPETTPEPAQINAEDDTLAAEIVEVLSEGTHQSGTENTPDSGESVNIAVPTAPNNTVTATEQGETSGQTTLEHDEGGAIGTIIAEYTDYLEQGVGSLYPCYMKNVYFEAVSDFLTVEKGSTEHKLVRDSGGLNVADMLWADALLVDTDWVTRKNPDIIVKCVASDVLGNAVNDTAQAEQAYTEMCTRQGWDALSAVTSRSVVLLSEELFKTDEGHLAAKLFMANAMYPTLFTNVDMNEYCKKIFGENCGIYAYLK